MAFSCGICDLTFTTKKARKKHKKTPLHKKAKAESKASRTGNFSCKLCNLTFADRKSRKKHYPMPAHQRAETERLASRTGIPEAEWLAGIPISSFPSGVKSKPERTCVPCQLAFHTKIVYQKHIKKSSCRARHAALAPNPSAGRSNAGAQGLLQIFSF